MLMPLIYNPGRWKDFGVPVMSTGRLGRRGVLPQSPANTAGAEKQGR